MNKLTLKSFRKQLADVEHDGFAIRFIKNPCIEVQIAAVQQDWYSMGYIKRPAKKVQLAAIHSFFHVIEYRYV